MRWVGARVNNHVRLRDNDVRSEKEVELRHKCHLGLVKMMNLLVFPEVPFVDT